MKEIIITTSTLVVLTIIACWAITKLIKAIINLQTLWKHKNTRSPPYFTEGNGIIYNKKASKLEDTGGHRVLPFS